MTPISSEEFRSYIIESNSINLTLTIAAPYVLVLIAIIISTVYFLLTGEDVDVSLYLGAHTLLVMPAIGFTVHFMYSFIIDYAVLLQCKPSKISIIWALVADGTFALLTTIVAGDFVILIGSNSSQYSQLPNRWIFYSSSLSVLAIYLGAFIYCQIYRYRISVPILGWDSDTAQEPPAIYENLCRRFNFFKILFAILFLPVALLLFLFISETVARRRKTLDLHASLAHLA